MLVLMSVVAIPLFIRFLDVPYRLVVPVVVTLCIVGTFALHSSMIETWLPVGHGADRFRHEAVRLLSGRHGAGRGAGSHGGERVSPVAP